MWNCLLPALSHRNKINLSLWVMVILDKPSLRQKYYYPTGALNQTRVLGLSWIIKQEKTKAFLSLKLRCRQHFKLISMIGPSYGPSSVEFAPGRKERRTQPSNFNLINFVDDVNSFRLSPGIDPLRLVRLEQEVRHRLQQLFLQISRFNEARQTRMWRPDVKLK